MKITNIKRTSGSKYELLIEGKKNIIYEDVLLEFNIYKPCEIAIKQLSTKTLKCVRKKRFIKN